MYFLHFRRLTTSLWTDEQDAARECHVERLAGKVARARYMHADAQQNDVIASLRDEVSKRDEQINSLRVDLAALQA